MKKTPALRPLTALAVSSLLLGTLALAACADDDNDGQPVSDDLVVATSEPEPPAPHVAATDIYLGPRFQRAM
ncbi:MAG: hypothetical protein ABIS84_11870 [Arachnia sp.]